jgi:hypothetical protein
MSNVSKPLHALPPVHNNLGHLLWIEGNSLFSSVALVRSVFKLHVYSYLNTILPPVRNLHTWRIVLKFKHPSTIYEHYKYLLIGIFLSEIGSIFLILHRAPNFNGPAQVRVCLPWCPTAPRPGSWRCQCWLVRSGLRCGPDLGLPVRKVVAFSLSSSILEASFLKKSWIEGYRSGGVWFLPCQGDKDGKCVGGGRVMIEASGALCYLES